MPEDGSSELPDHFKVTLIVPSVAAFAKNHQLISPDTFSPNSRLTSSGASRDRNDSDISSDGLGHPSQPRGKLPALAHLYRTAVLSHQVTVSGLEHHH